MKSRYTWAAIGLLILAAVGFQNCGQAGFQSRLIQENSFSSSSPTVNPSPLRFSRDTGLISAKFAGQFDSNCLGNSSHDACLVWKNPVASKGEPFGSVLEFGNSLAQEQVFGVKLANLQRPDRLVSNSLNVYYSGTDIDSENHLRLDKGQFRQAYSLDGGSNAVSESARSLSQLMAYFWLDHLEEQFKQRTGTFHASGAVTQVDAYSIDPAFESALWGNAFFTYSGSDQVGWQRHIVMGYAPKMKNNQWVKAHEMALSAEIYLHEMGHVNLFAAKGNTAEGVSMDDNGRTYYKVLNCADSTYRTNPSKNVGVLTNSKIKELETICDPNQSGTFTYTQFHACNSSTGCFAALNEGQADFHYLMIFPDSTALGETTKNHLGGLSTGPQYTSQWISGANYRCLSPLPGTEISRDVSRNGNKNIQQFFEGSTLQLNNCSNEIPGEIHGMGSAYATFLWEIYTHPKIDPRQFEKAFQAHLQKLGRSTDFIGAWMALRADYIAVGGEPEGIDVIDQVFSSKGLQKPALF